MNREHNILGGINMEVFEEYLAGIDHPGHRERTEEILVWVANKFPILEPVLNPDRSFCYIQCTIKQVGKSKR
jgi:hypothetical protein